MIANLLLVVGGMNMLGTAFGMNFVESVAGDHHRIVFVFYMLVGLAALYNMFRRDYYLPFLGNAVVPCGSLTEKFPQHASVSVDIIVSPNTNVIFWAAEPTADNKIMSNPVLAYNKYANSGVARSNGAGIATIRVRPPTAYRVPTMLTRALKTHVHYRTCDDSGILGPVKTVVV